MSVSQPETVGRLFEASRHYDDLRHSAVVAQLGVNAVAAAMDELALDREVIHALTDEESEQLLSEETNTTYTFGNSPSDQWINATCDFDEKASKLFGKIEGYELSLVATGTLGLSHSEFSRPPSRSITQTILGAELTRDGQLKLIKKRYQQIGTEAYSKFFIEVSEKDKTIIDAAIKKLAEVNTKLEATHT